MRLRNNCEDDVHIYDDGQFRLIPVGGELDVMDNPDWTHHEFVKCGVLEIIKVKPRARAKK